MKIIVTAGGTGGHIYPALAIIDEFKKREKKLDLIYIGTHNRMEKDLIPKYGYEYTSLEMYGFSKKMIFRNFKNLFLTYKAYKQSLKIMKEFKPDIVIGTGGYVTFPVLSAAKKLGVKTFIHEQNSIPGKTNKLLSPNIDLVGVSLKNSEKYFKKAKEVFYSGNPCSSNALKLEKINKESLGFSKNKKLIIIVAGSLGSYTVNKRMKDFLEIVTDYEVLYITGKYHYDEFIKDLKVGKNIKVVPYLDNLPGLMKDADLIISRAGASTISEIIAINIPSILIPSPYVANNHQYYNALDLVNLKVSSLLEEKDLTVEKLQVLINELLLTDTLYNKYKNNFKKIKTVDSAKIIYEKIKEIL